MSPGERAAPGRRDAARPQYGTAATGYPPPYYPPYGVHHPNAWLGAPLISMSGRNATSRSSPVSKLVMQAQGAPLIIQNRQDRKKFNVSCEQRNHRSNGQGEHFIKDRCEISDGNRPRNQQQQSRSNRVARNNNNDAVSVASDESSTSTNSETMLPRIIKPRKRRKKDRKPNNIISHELSTPSLDINESDHGNILSGISNRIFDESYKNDLQYHLDVKVVDFPDSVSETYRVSALGEALEATRFGVAGAASPVESAVSSCQCRYCDPVGQIWDADSIADLLDENSSGDFAPTKLEDAMKVVGHLGRRGADTVLRRSWSDPSSRAAERQEVGRSEALSSPNLYSLFPPALGSSSPEPRSPLALEISSEIVTSINGHRDLEIKLFSTSPPATKISGRSFFEEKSESDLKECSNVNNDQNCVVNSDKKVTTINSLNKDVSKSTPTTVVAAQL